MFGRLRSSPLKEGSKAPDFTLTDQNGERVSLSEALRDGPVVIYFYPKAFTAVCTAEACGFRDSHEAFADAGATVFGISRDEVGTQQKFSAKHGLNHRLLSDPDGEVHGAFGVRSGGAGAGFVLNDRLTFVIDGDGVVRGHFGGLLTADPHVRDSLDLVKRLATG